MDSRKDSRSVSYNVDLESTGKRIDVFLNQKIPDKSRSYFQKLINNKNVFVNEISVNKNYKLAYGDIVNIIELDIVRKSNYLVPEQIDLKILYEDEYLLIISKDPHITVHPAPGVYKNTIINALLYYFSNNIKNFTDKERPGIVHRLDKETSGLLIIAKNSQIQAKLSEMFKNRQIKKTYVALVIGNFDEKEGKIILPLGRSRIDRKKISVSADNGKEAETSFKVLKNFRTCSLLEIYPRTGRTHQIRVHFSYIKHALIGDTKYGNIETKKIAEAIGLKRHFLHATDLEFIHPVKELKVNIKDNLSNDLIKSLDVLKKSNL